MITYMASLFFFYTGNDVSVTPAVLSRIYLVFSLVYVAVVLLLVWWRAPKTFRIRV